GRLGCGMLIAPDVHDHALDPSCEDVLAAAVVVGADRSQRIPAARQAVAAQSVGERTGDADLALADDLAVDEQPTFTRRTLAELEIRRSCHSEFPTQSRLAAGKRVLRDDLELIKAEVVVGELQLLIFVDEEAVAAEAAAVGEQHSLGAFLGNLDLGGN